MRNGGGVKKIVHPKPTPAAEAYPRAWQWGENAPCAVCGSPTQARVFVGKTPMVLPACEIHTEAEIAAAVELARG